MPLSSQELLELKERCKYAHAHGFKIGLAEEYVALLEPEAGEVEVSEANSPSHILALIDAALKGRDKSPPKTAKKSEEKKSEKKAEAPQAPPPPPPAQKTEEKKPEAPKAEEKPEAPSSPEVKQEPAAEPKKAS